MPIRVSPVTKKIMALDYGQSSGSCRSTTAGYVKSRSETAVFQVWVCTFAQEKGHQAGVVFEDGNVQRRWLVVARGGIGTGTVLQIVHFKRFSGANDNLFSLKWYSWYKKKDPLSPQNSGHETEGRRPEKLDESRRAKKLDEDLRNWTRTCRWYGETGIAKLGKR